jgi:hypothetical protein
VRSTEISLGRTEPVRKIKTSGKWTSAWNATINATIFALPHREEELCEYGDYMDREFSSKVISAHRKIILYDEAVRGEVEAIVFPDGIKSEFGKGTYNSNVGKSQTDICRCFNSTARCPNLASTCYYRHVCSKCKKLGHPKQDCDSGEGKNSQKFFILNIFATIFGVKMISPSRLQTELNTHFLYLIPRKKKSKIL